MTENMKKFLEAVSKDEALKSELEALVKDGKAKDEKAFIEFAAKKGLTLTEDDFKQEEGELSEDELKAIAGGDCVFVGCGETATRECWGLAAAVIAW